MTSLIWIAFLLQGVFVQPVGAITGVIRDAAGKPRAGIRVAARAVEENTDTLVSIVQTDEAGRYRLEVAPGRYHIVAGRLDRPTYYPGVQTLREAAAVSVASGAAADGVDFSVIILQLTGLLRDAAGRPVQGIQVTALEPGRGPNLNEAGTAITDASGRYRLEVPPGLYTIAAGPAYYPEAARLGEAVSASTDTPAQDPVFIVSDFTISTASSIRGKDEELYLTSEERIGTAGYSSARLLLQTLLRLYPDSSIAPDAMYAFADSYFREGTPSARTKALEGFEHYAAFFPNAPRAAQARDRIRSIRDNPIPEPQ